MNLFASMFTRRWLLTTLLVVLGSALCIRLGIWQLDRLSQRQAFNAHYLEMSASTPLVLNSAPQYDLTTEEYRLVTVTGVYDPAHQVVLRNQFYENQPGYFLLTPLLLSDGSAILIERGWIPAEGNANPQDWRQYDQAGEVTISGTLRLGQTVPGLGGVPDPELAAGQQKLDFWNMINLERIGQQYPYTLLAVFVQPVAEPAPDAPPYPYNPPIEISEGSHLGYALQWFSFAAILFFGYPFFLRTQLNARLSETNKLEP